MGVAVAAMRARGWDGALVLAGPRLALGGSAAEERERLAADAGLRDAVVDLGPVPEPAKAWLYERAAAVVYPTVVEGSAPSALPQAEPAPWAG